MEVLAALEAEEQIADQELPVSDSNEHSYVPSGRECSWRDQLRMAINIAHLGIDGLNWVTDGCTDQAVRDKLDEVFMSWVRHLVQGERTASGSRHPVSDVAGPDCGLDPRWRRRAQYSALRHLYGCKQSGCAHRVLDGSWESTVQVRTPSVEQFRAAWQPIFETPSIKDNRRPACMSQVRWEILEPVPPAEFEAGVD